MSGPTWLAVAALALALIGGAFVVTCGGKTQTTDGPCTNRRPGLTRRCEHHHEWFVGGDVAAMVAWVVALGLCVWWWNIGGLTLLIDDVTQLVADLVDSLSA